MSRRKHPETKIDRALTCILLNIGFDEYLHEDVKYSTLLGMNNNGKKIVSKLRRNNDIVLLSRGANVKSINHSSIDAELLADRIYSKCMDTPQEGGYFLKKKPFISEV